MPGTTWAEKNLLVLAEAAMKITWTEKNLKTVSNPTGPPHWKWRTSYHLT